MNRFVDVGTRVRSYSPDGVGGDRALVREVDDGIFLAVVDVLGHGIEADKVAIRAEAFLLEQASSDIATLMNRLHERLSRGRGAAVGLAFLDPQTSQLTYTGIGNTVARKFGETEVRLVSRDGVVGQRMRTPRIQTVWFGDREVLLMYTDGVRSHFSLHEYPQLLSDSSEFVAHEVIERFGKSHDDAACIAVRYRR